AEPHRSGIVGWLLAIVIADLDRHECATRAREAEIKAVALFVPNCVHVVDAGLGIPARRIGPFYPAAPLPGGVVAPTTTVNGAKRMAAIAVVVEVAGIGQLPEIIAHRIEAELGAQAVVEESLLIAEFVKAKILALTVKGLILDQASGPRRIRSVALAMSDDDLHLAVVEDAQFA